MHISSTDPEGGQGQQGRATQGKPRGATPAEAEPARAEPARAEPARAGPARAGRARAEPARAEPARAEPARAGPARAGPARAGPARAGPARAGPARAGPARAGPARAEPARAEPARAEPLSGHTHVTVERGRRGGWGCAEAHARTYAGTRTQSQTHTRIDRRGRQAVYGPPTGPEMLGTSQVPKLSCRQGASHVRGTCELNVSQISRLHSVCLRSTAMCVRPQSHVPVAPLNTYTFLKLVGFLL
jgi:hypothetical protein